MPITEPQLHYLRVSPDDVIALIAHAYYQPDNFPPAMIIKNRKESGHGATERTIITDLPVSSPLALSWRDYGHVPIAIRAGAGARDSGGTCFPAYRRM